MVSKIAFSANYAVVKSKNVILMHKILSIPKLPSVGLYNAPSLNDNDRYELHQKWFHWIISLRYKRIITSFPNKIVTYFESQSENLWKCSTINEKQTNLIFSKITIADWKQFCRRRMNCFYKTTERRENLRHR